MKVVYVRVQREHKEVMHPIWLTGSWWQHRSQKFFSGQMSRVSTEREQAGEKDCKIHLTQEFKVSRGEEEWNRQMYWEHCKWSGWLNSVICLNLQNQVETDN